MNFKNYSFFDQDYLIKNKNKLNLSKDFEFTANKKNSPFWSESIFSYVEKEDCLTITHKNKEIKHENFKDDYVLKRFLYEISPLEDIDGFNCNGVDYQKEILDDLFSCKKSKEITGDTLINFKHIFKYTLFKNYNLKDIKNARINSNKIYYYLRNKILLDSDFYKKLKEEFGFDDFSWEDINTFAKLCSTPANYIYFKTTEALEGKSFNQWRGTRRYKGIDIEDKSDMSLQILKDNKNILKTATGCSSFEEFVSKFLLNDSFVKDNNICYLYKEKIYKKDGIYNYGKIKNNDFFYLIKKSNEILTNRNEILEKSYKNNIKRDLKV